MWTSTISSWNVCPHGLPLKSFWICAPTGQAAGAPGSAARATFEANLRRDLAAALGGGLPADRIVVLAVTAGSVVVDFAVLPDPATGAQSVSPAELAATLEAGPTLPAVGAPVLAVVEAPVTVTAPLVRATVTLDGGGGGGSPTIAVASAGARTGILPAAQAGCWLIFTAVAAAGV